MNLIPFKKITYIGVLLLIIALSACARAPIPSPVMREQNATHLAQAANWQLLTIKTPRFVLASYVPKKIEKSKTLTIYIEGDGFAWKTPTTISDNPTPINPVGLKLALSHPVQHGAAAYLARPCQYVSGMEWKTCSSSDWTNQRFSRKIIDASSEAVDKLKADAGANELTLVGYSGGGAVAALLAAQRTDVTYLVTVAGNLDTEYWVKQNKYKPLTGSLNPADQVVKLTSIEQLHFVGEDDVTVRPEVAEAYAERFPKDAKLTIKVIPGFDHFCCWAEEWPTLFK